MKNDSRVAGCSFGLYPMTKQFVPVILGALEHVDMHKVWSRTDDLETCVRGRLCHVFDVVQALFLRVAVQGYHVVFRGTFSIGCPGDTDADSFMALDTRKLNGPLLADSFIDIAGKFSIYPLGGAASTDGSYMALIYKCIQHMEASSLQIRQTHYATRFDGEARLAWKYLEQCFQILEDAGSKHTVMDLTISANSPTRQN